MKEHIEQFPQIIQPHLSAVFNVRYALIDIIKSAIEEQNGDTKIEQWKSLTYNK